MNKSPIPIRELRPEVPEEVCKIVDKAMAKADADRFQSAAKFALEVEKVMNKLYPNSSLMNNSKEYMLI
jgi:hypothetical protein